jgi:hypothetical protein
LLLALALFAFSVWRSLFLIDDAFISFRYARNWAEGCGPVYNVGAEAPVEGYSNFLWVVLLALGARVGALPEVLAHVLSIAAALGTLLLLWRALERRLELDPMSSGLGVVLLAGLPCFSVWATGGLETSLFGLLLFATWYALTAPRDAAELRRGLVAGALGAGLLLTRVEGPLWIGGLLVAAACAGRLSRARASAFVATTLAVLATHLLWRHAVYGEWVSNTVHAKGGFSALILARGARSLGTYALLFGWPLAALCAPFAAGNRERRRLALSAWVLVGGALAYNLAVGGDWMPMFRFMASASPFLALLLAVLLARLPQVPRTVLGAAAVVFALLPIFDVQLSPRAWREALYFREFKVGYQTEWERWQNGVSNAEIMARLGQALGQVARPGESWTGGAIGAVGYYSGIRVLGRNGLVHKGVAQREVPMGSGTAGHEKRVPRVWFRGERPSFYEVFLYPVAVPASGPDFDRAVLSLARAVLSDPLEAELRECTTVEVREVRGLEGLPERASLLLLVHTDDQAAARAFWARYGG